MNSPKFPWKYKFILLCIAFGAVCLASAWHFDAVVSLIGTIIGFLRPVIIGFVIAFILNVPMSALERLFARLQQKAGKEVRQTLNMILALVITLVLAVSVVGLVIWGIFPYLVDSVKSAIESVRAHYPSALAFLDKHGIDTDNMRDLINSFNLNDLASRLDKNLDKILKVSYSALSTVLSNLFVYFTSFVLGMYMLISKYRLKRSFNRLLDVTCKQRTAEHVRLVLRTACHCFSHFISGQCLEASILGTMFFIVLSLMQMPYAFLISVLIAVTAIIPYVGAFIGFFIGSVMILMTDPIKALIFAVTFLVLQQLEEHLIYPRVMGKSVGLPTVWTLLALLVGGQVGGILGMLLFIPLTATVYSLTRQYVSKKESEKETENNLNK